ncbi:aspartic peptidase domain-containing protein [Gigaspora rosea]|uniref:Aspartic peptidase domain-containing protein n=1 Tax=Gigaspora rosea TaxID=44941 RepID=A0A397W3G7_9GLOM|nr:aspartic peptidase domain-containing protein [Gigaspora rosea]
MKLVFLFIILSVVTIHNICAYPNNINLIKRLNIETNAIKKAILIRQAALKKYSYLKRFRSISNAKTSIDETSSDIATSESNTSSQVTVAITDIKNDEGYYTSIIVGNQEFRVLLDTGSSNLWIPNNNYNEWETLYGSGFAFGITEKDNVQIANLTAIEQIFGLADFVDDNFKDLECGVDKSKFEGNIMFTPAINSELFDTGTTLLIIPDDDATAIHKQIPGSKFDEEQGVNYEIPSRDLSFGKASESQCISGIQPGFDSWLVSQTFLKNVYSAFDVGNKKVGFAHSK